MQEMSSILFFDFIKHSLHTNYTIVAKNMSQKAS